MVEKKVHVPVHVPVHIPVERKVPVAVPVIKERPVPYPVKVAGKFSGVPLIVLLLFIGNHVTT
jgi:hypothetical protein